MNNQPAMEAARDFRDQYLQCTSDAALCVAALSGEAIEDFPQISVPTNFEVFDGSMQQQCQWSQQLGMHSSNGQSIISRRPSVLVPSTMPSSIPQNRISTLPNPTQYFPSPASSTIGSPMWSSLGPGSIVANATFPPSTTEKRGYFLIPPLAAGLAVGATGANCMPQELNPCMQPGISQVTQQPYITIVSPAASHLAMSSPDTRAGYTMGDAAFGAVTSDCTPSFFPVVAWPSAPQDTTAMANGRVGQAGVKMEVAAQL
ncbi:hypothetical protein M427DRAFT_139734 [Gonapodya prolifera JEL478]|uniref:Uncharacterized protein n=1 Tax=Gonapodya prolifera (strain JEL478) TaxID=1344416 RepID=A0A139A195_GONPJ|nr:hypothetical protein M427DRAFT_139734 [Gonapodya prolifera JEL478]|eukprot:KXS10305.1 hypothetical protein M427DRAFT_139734 [Gonapodya prolifera JEL478]